MLLQRERPLASAFPRPAQTDVRRRLPAPAALPNLTEALARRAMVFGPVDLDEVTVIPDRGPTRLGIIARRIVEALDPRGRP